MEKLLQFQFIYILKWNEECRWLHPTLQITLAEKVVRILAQAQEVGKVVPVQAARVPG